MVLTTEFLKENRRKINYQELEEFSDFVILTYSGPEELRQTVLSGELNFLKQGLKSGQYELYELNKEYYLIPNFL